MGWLAGKKRQEPHMKDRALTPVPSESEAIERAKQGDAEAFEFLYGLHKRHVHSLCLRMTANTAEAEAVIT
jgi:RNA polymerase sigma-70 factor (ECF subfamily)